MLLLWTLFGLLTLCSALQHPLVNAGGCNPKGFAAPPQKTLTNIRTATINVTGTPLSPVYVRNGSYAFFSSDIIKTTETGYIGVLDTTALTPKLIHMVNLTQPIEGIAVSSDEKYLYVTNVAGAYILDVSLALTGSAGSVIGSINGSTTTYVPGLEPFQVIGLDTTFPTIVLAYEYGTGSAARSELAGSITTPGNIEFVQLHNNTNGTIGGTPSEVVNLGYAVAGLSLSPKGDLIYATSETADVSNTLPGFHTIFNGTTFQVLGSVLAGCSPVRAQTSPDGKTVWSTARGSNLLLAFDAAKTISDPAHALIATVDVGTAPVGLAFVRNGTRILVADSNRFYTGNASGISVVDVHAALHDKPANLGSIPTGLFPREIAVTPDGKHALITDYTSGQIQAIDVASLP